MTWFESIPLTVLHWVMTSSVAASFVVGLIVAAKKIAGRRLSPEWHYGLWFIVIAKLILPWTLKSSFSLWGLTPEQTMAFNDTVEGTSPITQSIYTGPKPVWLVLLFVWLSGALIMAFRICCTNRRFAHLLHNEQPCNDRVILHMLETCKRLLSIRRKIRIVESDLVSGPALFGILRPCLVIPNLRALAQSPDQLHHIFLHELAHVKRNDVAANVVMQMLLAIHWFNPLIWYAYYRMRDDQELACDALALSRLQPDETKAYGKTLIDLFEQASSSVGMAGVASLTGSMSQIRRRMVLIRTFRPSSLGRSLLGALVFAAFCVFVFIAGKSTVTGERIMYIGGGDISKQHAFQIGKVNGEWKVKFITDSGQTDRTMAGATGILIVPETGYHSTPGTRDLIFQKGPHDKEWKLISIQER